MKSLCFALFLMANLIPFTAFAQANPDLTGVERVHDLAAQIESGSKAVDIKTEPTTLGCHLLQYKLPKEVRLAPKESLYFAIPDSIRANPLVFMVVGHRQHPQDQRGEAEKLKGRDEYPGLTLTEVWSEIAKEWRTPKGEWSSGGKIPAKFAETRNSPEKDAIFDVGKLGSLRTFDGGGESKEPLYASAARISSIGKDPIYVSEFSVRTYPGDSTEDEEKIFTSGTVFSKNAFTMEDDRYGGGDRHGGLYPGALKLQNHSKVPTDRLPDQWKSTQNGQVEILARPDKILREIMVKLGDAHPDGLKNDDGNYGSHGKALFTVLIRHADKTESVLMKRENVGPQGTFRVPPLECDYISKAGDEIILRSEKDTTYVMGVKIRYSDKK